MLEKMSSLLGKTDSIYDYVPFVSTAKSLVDLFNKYARLPRMSRSEIAVSHYYTQLEGNSGFRYFVLLIPVVGNIVVFTVYTINRRGKKEPEATNAVAQSPLRIEKKEKRPLLSVASVTKSASEIKEKYSDRDHVSAAVRQNGMALQFADEELRGDKDVVLAAVRQNGMALQFADEELRRDKDVVLAAVRQNGMAIVHASDCLRDNNVVARAAVRQNNIAIMCVSSRIKQYAIKKEREDTRRLGICNLVRYLPPCEPDVIKRHLPLAETDNVE